MNSSSSNNFKEIILFGAGGIAALTSVWLYLKLRANSANKRPLWITGTNQPMPYKSRNWKSYDPSALKESRGIYGLMISTVLPRPIALVSSQDANGTLNCAPFSYFNAVSHDPPLLVMGICFNSRTNTKKDTLLNIEATGEYVVNIMSGWFLESANHTCGSFPSEENEMELAGLTTIPSNIVKPPRVKESAIQLECKVYDIKHITNADNVHTVSIVTGSIVKFHIHEDVLTKDSLNTMKPIVDWVKLQPVGRLGGDTYTLVNNGRDLPRPDRKV